ncbi:MAG TPA: hypothetical protein VE127_04005 [Solirubrobacteraceae bacterium]|nr:hypothetical protein [Solirubrobacteraceae bacterium]
MADPLELLVEGDDLLVDGAEERLVRDKPPGSLLVQILLGLLRGASGLPSPARKLLR